ncbi:MAG: glycerol-3-phosphate acyltransferase [Anaerolineae bacterium]
MNILLWTLVAFFSGSIPFSLLIARYALRADIREVGDGNPGATNVLRAGSKGWAAVAMLLDMFKAALPVSLAYVIYEIRGPGVIPIALAPVLGHAFSPFLGGRGGKAVAATGGIWIGLTYGVGTVVATVCMSLGYAVQSVAGWAVALGWIGLGGYLAVFNRNPVLLAIWLGNGLILAWKHRADFRQPPRLRSWLSSTDETER